MAAHWKRGPPIPWAIWSPSSDHRNYLINLKIKKAFNSPAKFVVRILIVLGSPEGLGSPEPSQVGQVNVKRHFGSVRTLGGWRPLKKLE